MADPATDIQRLGADYPIALLPVRIETKFVASSPPELRIRVYPDEIAADLHDPTLSADEIEAGQAYWQEGWDAANEPDAWRRLAHRHPANRAAWIARATTPTNVAQRPAGTPTFPALQPRAAGLGSATTQVLPDCWLAIAYRGGAEIHRVTSSPIVEPLALSYRPDAAENAPDLVSRHELKVEPELLWAIDFDRAVEVGMALKMPLDQTDLQVGFERLIVLGVKTTISADEGGKRLATVLDAHHYSRGLALVAQGTPTNSSSEGASGYPPPDDPDRSFAIERGGPLLGTGSDGAVLAQALGVPKAVFEHVDGAGRIEQQRAAAMNEALWPCTLGYFLEQMMAPLVSPADLGSVRGHFTSFVRGRGPYPAFRVGRVPYGLLPTTSVKRWKSTTGDVIDAKLPLLLQGWRSQALNLVSSVARVGQSSDPDADLLGVLAVDASCREVRLRETLGPGYIDSILQLFAISPSLDDTARATLVQTVLTAIGLGGTWPRIAGMTFADEALRVSRPFISGDPLSEDEPLANNYVDFIRTAAIDDLRKASQPESEYFKHPLLFHLLRQAALVEYGRVGVDLAIKKSVATELDRTEVELFRIGPGTLERKSPWERLAAPIDGLTGGAPLGTWLLDKTSSDTDRAPVRRYREVLAQLGPVPTAELERLFTETLDTCSHRLDAWITSIASRRLSMLRKDHPTGVHLGAFAWVEGLHMQDALRPGTAGGFIHAPSSAHAATAAILRNAHLTRTGTARAQVTVDLSSARVRRALRLLEAVRQGQPAGAVLGYHFERALHERQLDQYIAPFRRKYPLSQDPAAPEPTSSSERLAARDVVNGLTLRDRAKGLPPIASQSDQAKVNECLALLDDQVDAAADLLMAESVYQAVQGNIDRAGATLASLAGGGTIPTPQVTAVPRSGTYFTQRVAILLGNPTGGWSVTTPRTTAEPRVEKWLESLLGSAANVRCRVSHASGEATISLANLGLAALDLLAIRGTGPDLDARIRWHARTSLGIPGAVEIHYERAANWPFQILSFPEAFEVTGLVGELIQGARPLIAADLQIPGTGADAPTGDNAALVARASTAVTQLADVRGALDAAIAGTSHDALRSALWAATGFGVREAVPTNLDGIDDAARTELLAQAQSVQAELARRAQEVAAASSGLDRLRAMFGPELPILPPFAPSNRADLDEAIAYGPTLVGDVNAPRRWFERLARVRPALDRLRLAGVATEAAGGAKLDLEIAQLPHVAGGRWIGRSFDPSVPAQRPKAGTFSLALHRALSFPSVGIAGLLLDDWAEVIPADTQLTAFAVHHDAPGAEAAQCVLLAVPPTPSPTWDLPSLIDTIHETLDLAKIRAVDSEQLGAFALVAPCIYIAANVADETIGLDLAVHRMDERIVLASE